MFPIESFLQHCGQKKVILCGYGLGGAVAALWSIILDLFFSSSGHASSQQPMCFTFGAPCFYDTKMKKFCESRLKGQMFHFYSESGPFLHLGDGSVSPVGKLYTASRGGQLEELEALPTGERAIRSVPNPNGMKDHIIDHLDVMEGPLQQIQQTEVTIGRDFLPKIINAKLLIEEIVDGTNQPAKNVSVLLDLSGSCLSSCIIDECTFNFGFPFPVRNGMEIHNGHQELIIRSGISRTDIQPMSDHGTEIVITTPFGKCGFRMTKEMFQSRQMHQGKFDELPSSVIKTAFQRAMALKEIGRAGSAQEEASIAKKIEQIVQDIVKISLGDNGVTMLRALTASITESGVGKAFSTETGYVKVGEFLKKLEDSLNRPVKLEDSFWYKFGWTTLALGSIGGVLSLAGGALAWAGVFASSANLELGLLTSAFLGVGKYFTTKHQREEIKNYFKFLSSMVTHLEKQAKNSGQAPADLLDQVKTLKDKATLSSLERALAILWKLNKESLGDFFNGQSTTLKRQVELRIRCALRLLELREVLDRQCFIGVIGNQDAGKTTLLNQMFGFSGETGQFVHTSTPVFHQLEDTEVYVVDYPGSSSLEEHAKTFSICGAMNNLVVVIVPFTGDVSDVITNTLSKVFSAMQDSTSSRVILCINKCSYGLQDAIQGELKKTKNPIAYLRKNFANKMNAHFATGADSNSFQIDPECILFTDWKLPHGHEYRRLGIVGVDAVEGKIAAFLEEKKVERIPKVFQTAQAWILAGNCAVAVNAAALGIDHYQGYITSQAGTHSFSKVGLGQLSIGEHSVEILMAEINGELNDHLIITFHTSKQETYSERDLKPGPNHLPQGQYCTEFIPDARLILDNLLPFLEAKFLDKAIIFCGYGAGGILAALVTLEMHKSNRHERLPQCLTFETPLFCSDLDSTEYRERCFINIVLDRDNTGASSGSKLQPLGKFSFLIQESNFRKVSSSEISNATSPDSGRHVAKEIHNRIKRIRFGESALSGVICSTDFDSQFCGPAVTSARLRIESGASGEVLHLVVHGTNLECFQAHLCRADWNYPFIDKSVKSRLDPFSKALDFQRDLVCFPDLGEEADTLVIVTPFGRVSFADIKFHEEATKGVQDNPEKHHIRHLISLMKTSLFRGLNQIDDSLLSELRSMDNDSAAFGALLVNRSANKLKSSQFLKMRELSQACEDLVSNYVKGSYPTLPIDAPPVVQAERPHGSQQHIVRKILGNVAPSLAAATDLAAAAYEIPKLIKRFQGAPTVPYADFLKLLAFKCSKAYAGHSEHEETGTLESVESYLAQVLQRHETTLSADLQLNEDSRKEVERVRRFLAALDHLRKKAKQNSVIALLGTARNEITKTAQKLFYKKPGKKFLIPTNESNGLSVLPVGAEHNFHIALCHKPSISLTSAALMADIILVVLRYSNDPDTPLAQADLDALQGLKGLENIHNNIFVLVNGLAEEHRTLEMKIRCAAQINETLVTWVVLRDRVFLMDEQKLGAELKDCLVSMGKEPWSELNNGPSQPQPAKGPPGKKQMGSNRPGKVPSQQAASSASQTGQGKKRRGKRNKKSNNK